MAFKSYAKGGKYGSYNVLPISKEVNEDLRIANEKVQNIQLTAQAKANHAQEYISALNNKFKVEDQNRDQNNQFFKDNHKRIYEGEQRQFEGEMAEMQRRHAKEAQKEAEPSVLEKALPHILSLVTIGAGMVAETAAATKAAGVAKATDTGQQLSNAGINPNFNTPEFQALAPEVRNQKMQGMAAKTAEAHSWSPEQQETFLGELKNSINYKGEQLEAFQQAGFKHAERNAQHITLKNPKNDSSMFSSMAKYQENLTTQYHREVRNQLGGGDGSSAATIAGQKYFDGASQRVKDNFKASTSKFFNSQRNAALKTQMEIGLKDYNLSIHTDVLHSVNGTGFATGLDTTPAQNLYTLAKRLKDVDANGQWGPALDLFDTAVVNEAQVTPAMLRDVKGLILADAASGLPEGAAKRKNRVEQAFATMIDNKKAAEVETRRKHNNYRRVQGDAVIRQHDSLETPSEQKAFIEGLGDDIKTLPANVQRHLLKSKAHGGQSPAKAQSKMPGSYMTMTEMNFDVETRIRTDVSAANPNFKKLNITPTQISAVRNDALRLLPGIIGKNTEDYKRNPGEYWRKAVGEAMKEQTFTVDGTGIIGEVKLKGADSPNQRTEHLEVGLGNIRNWSNPGKPLTESLDLNPEYKTYFEGIADDLDSRFAQNKEPMTYTELANTGILNHPYIEAAYRIAKARNPHISRSYIAMQVLQEASGGKAPNIISAVATPQEVAAAHAAGVTAIPDSSTVSQALHAGTATITPSSYARIPWNPPNSAEAHRIGTTGVPTGHKDYKDHNIVMQTPELASLAKGLLDAYPGLADEVQRSQQTAAYNAGVPGSSTASNHLADGGHGALDLAGPKADALAANPTGEAANWIWEWHDHHWHIEPKKPQQQSRDVSADNVLALEKARQMSGETTAEEFNQTRAAIEASTGDATTATSMQPLFETKGGHNIFVGDDGKYYVKKPGEVLRTEISEQMMKAYEEDAKAGTVRAVLGGSN